MVETVLIIPILASFFVTLLLMPSWIKKMHGIGLVWDDMNKYNSEKVAGSGGMITILGFVIGVLVSVAYIVFVIGDSEHVLVGALAMMSSVLLLLATGFIDDLFGWRKGGLSRRSRIALVFFAAIPLMAINAGRSAISVPFFGSVDLGIIYPIIFIPIGIIGAATTFNFLAGFNGLEAGNGILILTALSILAYFTGSSWLAVMGLCMVASLLAFLVFNFCPAKVFPGDSLTYSVGGIIAMMAILGNFEKLAVFFFIPVIIEFGLKLRGKLVKQSFGAPQKDGSLKLRYEKIYSLNHLAIYLMERKGVKPTEMKVVLSLWIFQAIVILLSLLIFGRGIF